MATTDPVYRNLINFVPEQPQSNKVKKDKEVLPTLSGQEIKSFYESVVLASSSCDSTDGLPILEKEALDTANLSAQKIKRSTTRSGKRSKNRKKTQIREFTNKETFVNVKQEPVCSSEGEIEVPHTQTLSTEMPPQSTPSLAIKLDSFTHLERRQLKLLQAAQLGDPQKVCELLKQGAHLNYKDFYGWTALMCAAKEGHVETVVCLLDHGADSTLLNNEGLSASCLARQGGHLQLAKTISSYLPFSGMCQSQPKNYTPGSFHCPTCKETFSESERTAHSTSTVHLFNSGRKRQHPAYLLPETNRGFQMLLRSGWQIDKGLGPDGKGVKYPVKTVLKRNREGLGNDFTMKRAKITHFNPRDERAVDSMMPSPGRTVSAKKSAQYSVRAKEKRQRRKEINFRLEFRD